MKFRVTAILETDADGVYAFCPELKGWHTQGIAVEEALKNLQEAAELYLETMSAEALTALNARKVLFTTLDLTHA